MYTIVASKKFKQQLKKIVKSGRKDFAKLEIVIGILQSGIALPSKFSDHQLKGVLKDFRECHIAPDWLLIYRKFENLLILELVATGGHGNLFD